MKVLTPGHLYELDMFEDTPNDTGNQRIQFIEKEASPFDRTQLVTINNGTTNEEVLTVLIDRLNYLQSKFPCRENALAITKLEEALLWLDKRTADRKKRNVEGKQLA